MPSENLKLPQKPEQYEADDLVMYWNGLEFHFFFLEKIQMEATVAPIEWYRNIKGHTFGN